MRLHTRAFLVMPLLACLVLGAQDLKRSAVKKAGQASAKETGDKSATGTLKVSDPGTGHLFVPGDTVTFKWQYTGLPGQHVKVVLLKDGKPATELSPSVPLGSNGNGTFSWVIPVKQEQADGYRLRVQSVEQPQIKDSSSEFAIRGRVDITSPSEKAVWAPGTNQVIAWTYSQESGKNVKLVLLKNGNPLTVITPSTSIGRNNEGQALWTIPPALPPGKYSVQIQSLDQPLAKNVSLPFTIMGRISLQEPVAGQNYIVPAQITVRGEAHGCGSKLKVDFIILQFNGAEEVLAFTSEATVKDGTFSLVRELDPVFLKKKGWQNHDMKVKVSAVQDSSVSTSATNLKIRSK